MAIVIDDAVFLLMMTVAKAAMKEALFWSQGKTHDEIVQRKESEEEKTSILMNIMKGD